MATTITDSGNFLIVSVDGVNRLTAPKARITLHVDDDGTLNIVHDRAYSINVIPSHVSDPVSANAEALRTNILSILNS